METSAELKRRSLIDRNENTFKESNNDELDERQGPDDSLNESKENTQYELNGNRFVGAAIFTSDIKELPPPTMQSKSKGSNEIEGEENSQNECDQNAEMNGPDNINNIEFEKQNMFLVNNLKKEDMNEYNDFANKDYGFKEKKIEAEKHAVEACIEQDIFNLKVEKIVGLEDEKREFDEKFKEILLQYISSNSYKNKSNTGTIIGMAVFGILGFVIFSGTIYLSIIGGVVGMGIGRIIGTRFKSKMEHQTLDQRLIFEMNLVMKWSISQRKKKKNPLSSICLRLLLETIVMETAYFLDKLELKRAKSFIKQLCKFLLRKDNSERIIENIPTKEILKSLSELNIKKELYRLFNFYIPICRTFLVYDAKNYQNYDLYSKIFNYVKRDSLVQFIIDLCEANETLSSQCEVTFDHIQIKRIICEAIQSEEKSEAFK